MCRWHRGFSSQSDLPFDSLLLVGACWGPGTGMMRYHLFGEFMSIVDILEATSKEGVCQISDACGTVAKCCQLMQTGIQSWVISACLSNPQEAD